MNSQLPWLCVQHQDKTEPVNKQSIIGEEGAGPPGGANGMRAAGGGEVTAFSEVDTGVTGAPGYSFVPTPWVNAVGHKGIVRE